MGKVVQNAEVDAQVSVTHLYEQNYTFYDLGWTVRCWSERHDMYGANKIVLFQSDDKWLDQFWPGACIENPDRLS